MKGWPKQNLRLPARSTGGYDAYAKDVGCLAGFLSSTGSAGLCLCRLQPHVQVSMVKISNLALESRCIILQLEAGFFYVHLKFFSMIWYCNRFACKEYCLLWFCGGLCYDHRLGRNMYYNKDLGPSNGRGPEPVFCRVRVLKMASFEGPMILRVPDPHICYGPFSTNTSIHEMSPDSS